MLIYLVKVSVKFSYFSEYFSIFREPKSIYLRYLKIFSKALNTFLSSLGAKSFLVIFLDFLEPSRYFLDIKYDFSHFLELLILKMNLLQKNKISLNPRNIYMDGTLPPSPFQISKPFP
jgi:hypothetical protein